MPESVDLEMRSRLTALLALLALGLALAPSARAGVRWVVLGHGFGHGVGMSQYGAYGYAKHGKGYRFILGHYYRGTTIGTPGARTVRVLIDTADSVAFSGATAACGRTLDPRRRYVAGQAGGGVQLRGPRGRPVGCGSRLRATGRGRISIDGVAYRGALEAVPAGGSLNVVNALPVDQYVKGVVPNESPSSWPLAALEAQAVASRSYALADQVSGDGFDLYPDTRSQVYGGLGSETARSDRAADLTQGQVVMYGGKVAQTFFSACSGGHTESVQNVFFGPPIPYLVGVPDPYDGACPLHSWKLTFSGREISAKLGAYLKGQLKRVVVTQRGASPRIVWAKLFGTGGVTKIRGDQLGAALGAYDSWMQFRKIVDGKVVEGGGEGESPPPSGPAGGLGS